jgi:hypothetical protein
LRIGLLTVRLSLAAAAAVAVLAQPARADSDGLKVWPVAGLFGLEQTECNRAAGASADYDSAKVNRNLCAVVDGEEQRAAYGQIFVEQVGLSFQPYAVRTPAQDVPESVAVSRRLAGTLIASLHMSRADIWTVDKRTGASEVFLPFTLTLNLTNAMSGEVMFTETISVIPESTFSTNNIYEPSRRALPAQIRAAITQLVQSSAAKFKPYPLVAKVHGKLGDAYLIDKGRAAGLRIGDDIGPDASVIYADADYALIKPVLVEFKTGEQVTRQVAAPAEYLAKPSMLVVPAAMPRGMPKAYITQIFEEVLGAQAMFAIMPVNQNFPVLRNLATSRVGMSSTVTAQRSPPDYVVHFDVYAMPSSEVETNVGGVRIHTFEAHAVASILDRSGRVVFATAASDRIQDQVSGGIGFSTEQRQDTVTKNALLKLSQRIASEFKPQNVRLPLAESSDGGSVSDPSGVLSIGASGLVVRKAGRFPGIASEVWSPVGNYEVYDVDAGKAMLRSEDPITPKIRRNDLFVFDGSAMLNQSRQSFSACPGTAPADSQSRDLSDDPVTKGIGFALFARNFPAPVYLNSMPDIALDRFEQFSALKSYGITKPRTADFCVRAVLRTAGMGLVNQKGGLVGNKHLVTMGFTLHRDGQRLTASGLRAEVLSGPFQAGTDPHQIEIFTDRDALGQFSATASAAVKAIEIPK